jgi:hypothetical protein
MTSQTLLAVAAIVEAATGLALILQPALVVRLLLGGDISGAGLALGRVTGISLLSLGLACWLRAESTVPALRAMLTYNLLVTAYLAYLALGGELIAKLLLPVLALHGVFTLLFARALFNHQVAKKRQRRNTPS